MHDLPGVAVDVLRTRAAQETVYSDVAFGRQETKKTYM